MRIHLYYWYRRKLVIHIGRTYLKHFYMTIGHCYPKGKSISGYTIMRCDRLYEYKLLEGCKAKKDCKGPEVTE